MTDVFNNIIVVGTNVAAEAARFDGPHGIDAQGRMVQRLTVPSLTSKEQCQHIADLVLAHWMAGEGDGAAFDRELEAEISRMVAA